MGTLSDFFAQEMLPVGRQAERAEMAERAEKGRKGQRGQKGRKATAVDSVATRSYLYCTRHLPGLQKAEL